MRVTTALVLALALWASSASAQSADLISAGTHPRLIITPSNLATIKAYMVGAGASAWNAFLDQIEANWSTLDAKPVTSFYESRLCSLALAVITWQAGPDYNGRRQSDYTNKFLAAYDAAVATAAGAGNDMGVACVALAYDWGVGAGVLDATRRTAGVNYFKLVTNPYVNASYSPYHHRSSSYRFNYIWGGLAYGNDGIDDADATRRLNQYAASMTDAAGFLAMHNYASGTDGSASIDGWGYFGSALNSDPYMFHSMLFLQAYRSAKGLGATWGSGTHKAVEYFPKLWAYMLEPFRSASFTQCNGTMSYALGWRSSETEPRCFNGSNPLGGGWDHIVSGIQAFIGSDDADMSSLAKWEENNLTTPWQTGDGTRWERYGWFTFVVRALQPAVTSKDPATIGLPLSYHFNPYGFISMRTSWTPGANETLVACDVTPWNWNANNYSLVSTGGCMMSRGAPLIPQGGGAQLHHNYGEWSWGYNVPQFVDSGTADADKGGQRLGQQSSNPRNTGHFVNGTQWDVGGIKSGTGAVDLFVSGGKHDYDYWWADLTRAYDGPAVTGDLYDAARAASKVDAVVREMAFFRATSSRSSSSDLVCFNDYTDTTSTSYEFRDVWHFAGDGGKTEKPSVISRGSTTVTRNGHPHTKYTAATALNYNYSDQGLTSGKLYTTFLFPSSVDVVEVGGPNGSSQWDQNEGTSRSHEFENGVGVQNGPATGGSLGSDGWWPWVSQYHYEFLNGGTANQVVQMLYCFELAPSGARGATTTTALTGTGALGVRFGTQWGWITKNGTGTMATGYSFTAAASQTVDYLISKLPASTAITFTLGSDLSWTNLANGSTSTTQTSTAAGTIRVRVVSGSGANRTVSW